MLLLAHGIHLTHLLHGKVLVVVLRLSLSMGMSMGMSIIGRRRVSQSHVSSSRRGVGALRRDRGHHHVRDAGVGVAAAPRV